MAKNIIEKGASLGEGDVPIEVLKELDSVSEKKRMRILARWYDAKPYRKNEKLVTYDPYSDLEKACAKDEWHAELLEKMQDSFEAGNENLRFSKNSGKVVFSCTFPAYRKNGDRKNGDWWSREHAFLSSDFELAIEQLEYAGIRTGYDIPR